MANARTRFDNIRDYLARSHETTNVQVAGRPCAQLGQQPIVAFHQDAMAFRLHGRAREGAMALPGARAWHPRGNGRPGDDWVLLGASHMLRWDRLALEAVRCARERDVRGVQAIAPPPPPPDPEQRQQHTRSLGERFASLVARGVAALRLAR